MKPAVLHVFLWGEHPALPLALLYQHLTGLFLPCKSAKLRIHKLCRCVIDRVDTIRVGWGRGGVDKLRIHKLCRCVIDRVDTIRVGWGRGGVDKTPPRISNIICVCCLSLVDECDAATLCIFCPKAWSSTFSDV